MIKQIDTGSKIYNVSKKIVAILCDEEYTLIKSSDDVLISSGNYEINNVCYAEESCKSEKFVVVTKK